MAASAAPNALLDGACELEAAAELERAPVELDAAADVEDAAAELALGNVLLGAAPEDAVLLLLLGARALEVWVAELEVCGADEDGGALELLLVPSVVGGSSGCVHASTAEPTHNHAKRE